MRYWLAKSELEDYSIDDLAKDRKSLWTGVRNYQARNYLREMAVGDQVLFYHSNAEPSGVAGIAEVSKVAEPDPTQFDSRSDYFDSKSTPSDPRWFCPTLKFKQRFPFLIGLPQLRARPELKGMVLLQRGSRLSVMPVTASEFKAIVKMAG